MSQPSNINKCALIEPHVTVTPLPNADKDVYKNAYPPWIPAEGVRAIFGGFLLAQSISAAQQTLNSAFTVHSSQSYFLLPGNASEDIEYYVERITDGRTFATRQVRAMQAKVNIFIATIGFQKTSADPLRKSGTIRDVLRYDTALPDLGGVRPEDIDLHRSSDNHREMLLQMGFPHEMVDNGPADPFEWRHISIENTGGSPTRFRLRTFIRSQSRLSTDSPAVHLSALAFLTDEYLLGTLNLASPDTVGEKSVNVGIQTTMSHSIIFHSSAARADEWLVCERETSWAGEERVLVDERIWSYDTAQLILTCHSEGLVRLKTAKL